MIEVAASSFKSSKESATKPTGPCFKPSPKTSSRYGPKNGKPAQQKRERGLRRAPVVFTQIMHCAPDSTEQNDTEHVKKVGRECSLGSLRTL